MIVITRLVQLRKSMSEYAQKAALEALKEWKKSAVQEEDTKAEHRFQNFQAQIKDLQYNLDIEQDKMNKEFVIEKPNSSDNNEIQSTTSSNIDEMVRPNINVQD